MECGYVLIQTKGTKFTEGVHAQQLDYPCLRLLCSSSILSSEIIYVSGLACCGVQIVSKASSAIVVSAVKIGRFCSCSSCPHWSFLAESNSKQVFISSSVL